MIDRLQRERLLDTASESIASRLEERPAQPPALEVVPGELRREAASFVTLTIEGRLRGCCGTLEPRRALIADVWHNARAGAFGDPRFPPLARAEWNCVDLEISILSELVRLGAASEAGLLRQLEPGRHGLVLEWRGARATFLPAVWEQLPTAEQFLQHLKLKAGWSPQFWAGDIAAWRYETEVFGRRAAIRGETIGA